MLSSIATWSNVTVQVALSPGPPLLSPSVPLLPTGRPLPELLPLLQITATAASMSSAQGPSCKHSGSGKRLATNEVALGISQVN